MDLSDGEGSVTASESDASDTAGGGISGTVDDEAFETLAAEIREVLAELAQVLLHNLDCKQSSIFVKMDIALL